MSKKREVIYILAKVIVERPLGTRSNESKDDQYGAVNIMSKGKEEIHLFSFFSFWFF